MSPEALSLSREEQNPQQEFLTTVVRWASVVTPALALIFLIAFVRRPQPITLVPAAEALTGLGVVLWSARRVRTGDLIWPARLLGGIVLLFSLYTMMTVPEHVRGLQCLSLALGLLIATFLDRSQVAFVWAAAASAVYVAGLSLPSVVPLPVRDLGRARSYVSYGIVVGQLVLVAAFGRSMTRHLRDALSRSEAARRDLVQQKVELEDARSALAATAEDLERSNQELRSFAYVVSHDLRAPLRALTNYSRFLQEEFAGKLGGEGTEYLQGIGDSARHMDSLVAGLLEYSRIGRVKVEVEEVNVGDLLERIVNALHLRDRADLTLPQGAPPVRARPIRLEQIFTNLLDNAVKFHRPGARPAVTVEYADRGEVWEFAVRDDGIGIEPKYFARIFDIFQRLNPAEAFEGTGIGLSIVKKAVEEHGGKITVESTPGQGSTFRFTLPKRERFASGSFAAHA